MSENIFKSNWYTECSAGLLTVYVCMFIKINIHIYSFVVIDCYK